MQELNLLQVVRAKNCTYEGMGVTNGGEQQQ